MCWEVREVVSSGVTIARLSRGVRTSLPRLLNQQSINTPVNRGIA